MVEVEAGVVDADVGVACEVDKQWATQPQSVTEKKDTARAV